MTDVLNSVKTDVEVIKRDIFVIQGFYAKIDDVIEKLSEVSNNLSKMLIMHENKLQNHDQLIDGIKAAMLERKNDFEKDITLLHKRISDMKEETHTEREKYHKELVGMLKKIDDSQSSLDKRVTVLENWKWYIVGAAGVVGFLLSQVPWDKILFGG